MGEPLLGRPVLEALGLDCRKVLAAAADRHGGTIDVSNLVANKIDFRPGRIGRVLDGIFHADGCLLYTSPSPRDLSTSRMPSSA